MSPYNMLIIMPSSYTRTLNIILWNLFALKCYFKPTPHLLLF